MISMRSCKRPRNPSERVRGRDEHHLREVVVEIEVVVVEGVVLLGSSTSSSADDGSPRKSVDILSTSSSRNTGLPVPALFSDWMTLPGSAPMYVRRWPRISASSRTPPSDRRTNLRASRARDGLAERGLADARRPDEAQDRPLELSDQRLHREVLEDALLDLVEAVVVLVEDPLGFLDVELVFGVLVPGQREDPVDVVAHDRRLGGHRRHHLELLELVLDFSRASADIFFCASFSSIS